jgi:molybdenum cofactor synthesis domain-containing protein
MIRARVITCSDAASRGERDDRSGPAVRAMLAEHSFDVDSIVIVADDVDAIATAIENATADGARLVVTAGGTGIAPRDVTPEATIRVCERILPGFGERMRATSPVGALSRAVAATRATALIVNLPGSVKGATESLAAIIDLIPHALELLTGEKVEQHP